MPMRISLLPHLMITLTVVLLLALSAFAEDFALQPVTNGNVSYLTGGVGQEERGQMESVGKNYNLHVTNAEKSGALLDDIHVVVRDSKGATVVDTDAGPYFYAQLPGGSYVVESSYNGKTHQQKISVGKHAASVVFGW